MIGTSLKKTTLLKLFNLYPPFLGAGIRITKIAPDLTTIEVEMKLRFWNQNYVGTHFGGSLYSMVDPFFMLILIENLGSEHIVWDKAATIRFKKPGKGRMRARFHISKGEIESIRQQALQQIKVEPVFQVQVLDDSNDVIAEVDKTLYVRRKTKAPAENRR